MSRLKPFTDELTIAHLALRRCRSKQSIQRVWHDQRIVDTVRIRAIAAPRVGVRVLDESSAHRVELDMPAACQQGTAPTDEDTVKPPLPEVAMVAIPLAIEQRVREIESQHRFA